MCCLSASLGELQHGEQEDQVQQPSDKETCRLKGIANMAHQEDAALLELPKHLSKRGRALLMERG